MAETFRNVFDGGGLMGARLFPGERSGLFSDADWPMNFGRQKFAAQHQTDRLFLAGDGIAGIAANVVGRGDDQAVVELRPIGFREERIEFALRNGSIGVNRFRLNGPKFPIRGLRNQVDPFVRASNGRANRSNAKPI